MVVAALRRLKVRAVGVSSLAVGALERSCEGASGSDEVRPSS
jgi:hypothetical protein